MSVTSSSDEQQAYKPFPLPLALGPAMHAITLAN
jgi:hypothetical protein